MRRSALGCLRPTAQGLLPAGFELLPATYASGAVYAACRRSGADGELPHLHYEQWGTTLALAICGACLPTWVTYLRNDLLHKKSVVYYPQSAQ